jgi:hypothetical protein
MNGGPEFRSATIGAGLPAARVEGTLRRLTDAKLLPHLPRGRRAKGAGAWSSIHYAVAIIGLGALNPIDAPSVVAYLGEAKHTSSTLHTIVRGKAGERIAVEETPDRIIDASLLASLAAQIETFAEMKAEDRQACRQWAQGHFICLDASEMTASTVFQVTADAWGTDHFGPPQRNLLAPEPPRLSWGLEVKLQYEIVFIAAELLAETMAQRNGGLLPSEGEALAGAKPEGSTSVSVNDEAPDLAGSGASAFNNQPRSNATGQTLCSPEIREVGTDYQSPSIACGWFPLQSKQGTAPQCPPLMA